MQDSAAAPISTGGQYSVFFDALRSLHTEPYLAGDAKETVDILKGILETANPRSVVGAGLPAPAKMLVESALKGFNHAYVEDLKPAEAVQVISKADVGITWAEYGAARHGAIVEVVYDDALKLASSLPTVHVAILSSKNLLPDLPSAVAKIGDIVRSSKEGRMPVVSIISGPSKTADIELRLIYGVHGPHSMHVVLLDWI